METDELCELLRDLWQHARQSPDDQPEQRKQRVLAAVKCICPSAPHWLAELCLDEVMVQEGV